MSEAPLTILVVSLLSGYSTQESIQFIERVIGRELKDSGVNDELDLSKLEHFKLEVAMMLLKDHNKRR